MRTPLGPPLGGPQLPPIGYAPSASGQSQSAYGAPSPAMEGMQQYVLFKNYLKFDLTKSARSYPTSPYGTNNQMYSQRCE